MEELAVRTKKAARIINMSEVWLKKDRLKDDPVGPPFIRRGRAVLYPLDGLKKWLEDGE